MLRDIFTWPLTDSLLVLVDCSLASGRMEPVREAAWQQLIEEALEWVE